MRLAAAFALALISRTTASLRWLRGWLPLPHADGAGRDGPMLPQDEFRSEDYPISRKDRRGNGLPVRVRHHERLVKLATPQGAAKRRVNLRHKASGGVGAGLSQVSPERRPSHGEIVY